MLVKHVRENLGVFIVVTMLLLNPASERKPLTTVLIVPVITWQHRIFALMWLSTKCSFLWPRPKTFLSRKPKSRFTCNLVIHCLLSTLTLGLTRNFYNLPSPRSEPSPPVFESPNKFSLLQNYVNVPFGFPPSDSFAIAARKKHVVSDSNNFKKSSVPCATCLYK